MINHIKTIITIILLFIVFSLLVKGNQILCGQDYFNCTLITIGQIIVILFLCFVLKFIYQTIYEYFYRKQ